MQLRHRAALSIAVVCVLMASVLSLSSVAGGPSTDSRAPEPPDKPSPPPVEAPQPLPEKLDVHISKMVPPEYPEEPRAKGLEAIVFMQITLAEDLTVATAEEKTVIVGYPPLEIIRVGENGKVVEPIEAEGMDAYHEAFITAATEAALQWQLEVSPERASTGDVSIVVPIQFRLDGEGGRESEEL